MAYYPEVERFLAALDQPAAHEDQTADGAATRYWGRSASDDAVFELLRSLTERAPLAPAQDERVAALFRTLVDRRWEEPPAPGGRLPAALPELVAALYRGLGQRSRARHGLLQLLATQGGAELADWATCLVDDPPTELRSVFVAFAPLFRRRDYAPANVFPRLLDALSHPRLAASVLDLANYVTETGLADRHPAADRLTRMIGLLGELAQGLGRLEETLATHSSDAGQLAESVEDSVALAVALCRTLALIGDRAAIGKLNQTLELRHRRLRVEAAAALSALGEETGARALAELASEPVVRQRVLAYAAECDCLELIDSQFLTDAARAEGELAVWLAQPGQVGIPPTHLEVVDQRDLLWPGYEDEIACFLIRYTYRLADGAFSNIGLVGPVVHTFSADLGDLAPDDIYAAFAGWHAQHDEIYEQDVDLLNEAQGVEVARLERRLHDAGYAAIQPLRLGSFFGERALVARTARDDVPGIAVAEATRIDWWSTADKLRPLDPDVVYSIVKGRKLLRSFNP